MSNIRERNDDAAFRRMRIMKGWSVFFDVVWFFFFFALSMNQPTLYRRLIIAKRSKLFFSCFHPSFQSFDVRATAYTVHHTIYIYIYIHTIVQQSSHQISLAAHCLSYRRCADNVGVKHDKSAGVVHQTSVYSSGRCCYTNPTSGHCVLQRSGLFFAFAVTFGTAVYAASEIIRQTNTNACYDNIMGRMLLLRRSRPNQNEIRYLFTCITRPMYDMCGREKKIFKY